ncbi:MAG: sulfurtransferase [Dehalococcoidia bacterium]
MEYAKPELLAEPGWLAEHLDDPNVRIIDCATLEAYRRAHIPGAVQLPVHFYIKEEGPPGADHGTFILPQADFEKLMSQLGVTNDTLVVTYDDNNMLVAARLWWCLKYYGHTNTKVLNGGWHRWLTEGRPVTFHATRAKPVTFVATPNRPIYATAEDLMATVGDESCQIFDARSQGEWDGSNSRGNKRIGHVPGAKHLEWTDLVEKTDTRRFLPADDCERLLATAGIVRGKATVTY